MKQHSAIGMLVLFGSCVSQIAFAQQHTTVLPDSAGRTFRLNPTMTRTAMGQDAASALEAGAFFASIAAETSMRRELEDLVKKSIDEAAPIVQWTGAGALYEIRVVRSDVSDRNGFFNAQVVGNRAVFRGAGSSAEEALFRSMQLEFRPADPAEFSYDPTLSTYVFVSPDANGHVTATRVSYGTSADLQKRIQQDFGDFQLRYGAANATDIERWMRVTGEARRLTTDAGKLVRLQKLDADLRASKERVAKINGDLSDALTKAARAESTLRQIKTLKLIVDAGALANKAMTDIGDPSLGVTPQDSAEVTIEKVESYNARTGEKIRGLRVQLKGESEGALKLQKTLIPLLPPSAPREVQQQLSNDSIALDSGT